MSVWGVKRMLQLARYTGEETHSNFRINAAIGGFSIAKHQSGSVIREQQEREGSGHMFIPKLDPPSGFSDAFELSEAECDLDRGQTNQRNHRDFVIAV